MAHDSRGMEQLGFCGTPLELLTEHRHLQQHAATTLIRQLQNANRYKGLKQGGFILRVAGIAGEASPKEATYHAA